MRPPKYDRLIIAGLGGLDLVWFFIRPKALDIADELTSVSVSGIENSEIITLWHHVL